MAALQHVGIVHRRPACRIHCYCGPYRSIQRIRTNRIQSVRSALSMGKQFTRLLCRAYRQLCVLFHRRVAEKHTHFYHCPRHIRLVTYISMENGRTYCNTICPVGTVLGLLSRFSLSAPLSTRQNVTVANCVPATAKPRVSMPKTTSSITAVAWLAWIVSKSADRELYDTFPEKDYFGICRTST